MFPNDTVSSRSSSSRSGICWRNTRQPSLLQTSFSSRTSVNPFFCNSDKELTSFDASYFNYHHRKLEERHSRRKHSRADKKESRKETYDSIETSSDRHTFDSSSDFLKDKDKEYYIKDFLERYSLPRIVTYENGEPLLLYRCFENFSKIQASTFNKKGKRNNDTNILYFPDGYLGWFSLMNERDERCAICYSTLLSLVREQVCSFLSLSSFTAYTAQSAESADALDRVQYLKTVVRAGQVFKLRGVFQHQDKTDRGHQSTRSGKLSRSSRNKDLANRYAQLVDLNNQEMYVSLTTKGEFYEIYSSAKARLCFPGMLDKTGPLALDKDCLYRLAHLIRRVQLPVKVKLVSGPLPVGLPKDISDVFILEKSIQEPLLIACTLPSNCSSNKHEISCINLNSKHKVSRSTLGFDSEYKLFKSQRLQAALSFCHKNIDQWNRHVRLEPKFKEQDTECTEECSNTSKNPEEIRRYTEANLGKQLITKEVIEKFTQSKKWYKHFKILKPRTEPEKFKDHQMDGVEKVKSIDRYKDMSKLIEDKFGRKNYSPVKKSASFMFTTRIDNLTENDVFQRNSSLLKCQSLDTQINVVENTSKKKEFNSNISIDTALHTRDRSETELFRDQNSSLHSITTEDLNKIYTEINVKPDLIPSPQNENLFITRRLCSEFHVKTKIQKKSVKSKLITPENSKSEKNIHIVQIHDSVQEKKKSVMDDLPYSQVLDEVSQTMNEPDNIYAEICDTYCKCSNKDTCVCNKESSSDPNYQYVKLGSKGESITQSSDDDLENIYKTLR